MRYHTIKSERYQLRCNGKAASYPVYEHQSGKRIGTIECYALDVDRLILALNKGENVGMFPYNEVN
jgi:hypothetical protein